jgi:hypothetical protein
MHEGGGDTTTDAAIVLGMANLGATLQIAHALARRGLLSPVEAEGISDSLLLPFESLPGTKLGEQVRAAFEANVLPLMADLLTATKAFQKRS